MDFVKFKKIIEQDHKEYRSIPFWSWNNSIEESELVKQIEDMHSVGIGGFIMHARTGLKIEYLGEKWFSCIDACLKKAKELGMEAWVYDENGWPSGFVGGKLLENHSFRAKYLTYEVKPEFDKEAFVVYKKTAKGYFVVDKAEKGLNEYHSVYLGVSPSNTDILKPEVVDAFISETHEKYYSRFKKSFGKELVGFFTDEPQYFRWHTPYSDAIEKEFENKEFDLKANLIYLFKPDKEGYAFKTEYYKTINDLYTKNFYKKIYDWCTAHKCKLTGHSIEESGLGHQMSCSAGVMQSYEYEHIPAIDWLGKYIPDELITRQIGSVASQFDKKFVLTETFACCGYDVTPKNLKSIGEYQFFGGVNRICQHLYPYSISAQGKFDHPPFFNKHSNWFNEFKTFNRYFERLGYIIGETKDVYDMAIIHPIRSVYMDYMRLEHEESIKEIEQKFRALMKLLSEKGITYHFIDEAILAREGKVTKNGIKIGSCEYGTVLIPEMDSISSTTLDILTKFNGKLCSLAKLKYVDGKKADVNLKVNITLDEIEKNAKLKIKNKSGRYSIYSRKGKLGEFVFIKNFDNEKPCSLEIENFEEYRALNLNELTLCNIQKEVTIQGLESLILVKDDSPIKNEEIVKSVDFNKKFKICSVSENYLVMEKIRYSFDGKTYTDEMNIQKAFEDLLRKDYKGDLFVKYTFNVKDKIDGLKLILEQGRYKTFTVNGKKVEITKSNFDILFLEADISKCVKVGENEIIYSTDFYEHDGVNFALFDKNSTESLVNCLYYDTSIENMFIKGDFSLDENFAITNKALPGKNFNIEKQGYPFFKGNIVYKGVINYDGNGKRVLELNGGFLVASVKANGKTKELILDNKADITDLLIEGNNEVEITLKISLRNLFGPLHNDQVGISPYSFTFRGQWKDGKPVNFKDEFTIVPVGLQKISVKEIKSI